MYEVDAVDAGTEQHGKPWSGDRELHGAFKYGDDPVLAARALLVVVVHVPRAVAREGNVIGNPLRHHLIEQGLGQPIAVLDGVATGGDGVLQTFSAEHMATRLAAALVRLVDDRRQHVQRVGGDELHLACGAERIGPTRIQLYM